LLSKETLENGTETLHDAVAQADDCLQLLMLQMHGDLSSLPD
jgi:hypothetical protein